MYNTALGFLQNKFDAEDLTQEVFIKIVNAAHTFKGNSTVKTWIYRITINTSINQLNKQKKILSRQKEEFWDIPFFDHPGILLENKEDARIIFKAINTLGQDQKTVFILAYIEGQPRQEISNILDKSLKATESLLQRAKQNLRKKLEKWYDERRNF